MLKLYIDANSIVADHFSGVGHYALGMIRALDTIAGKRKDLQITLVAVRERLEKLHDYKFKHVAYAPIDMSKEEFHGHLVAGDLPTMDTKLGAGVYFFPDFVTWPLASSRAITTVHDLSFEQVPQFVDDGNAAFLRRAVRYSANTADHIATVTRTMQKVITDFYKLPAGKVIVTDNAYDTRKYQAASAQDIAKLLKKFGLPKDYILCVGNIEPRKNQISLLEAYAALPDELSKRHAMILVGAGGWKNQAIYKKAEQLSSLGKQVIILENKVGDADMPTLYSAAFASVNPSFYEGFGMPTVEAMACETPVLVSDIPVMREVAGKAAVYVDPNDVASITKGLRRLLTLTPEKRQDFITWGLQKVAAYTWNGSAETLLAAAEALPVKNNFIATLRQRIRRAFTY